MKPAICCVCGKPSTSQDDGDWVKFQDYDEETTTELSHPVGLEYFSNKYIDEARKLVHMNSIDAVNKMKAMHSFDSIKEVNVISKKKWWQRWLRF